MFTRLEAGEGCKGFGFWQLKSTQLVEIDLTCGKIPDIGPAVKHADHMDFHD